MPRCLAFLSLSLLPALAFARPLPDNSIAHRFLRSDVVVRISHDDGPDRASFASRDRDVFAPEQRARPDNGLGQASHFLLPIRSDIKLRVNVGDDPKHGDRTLRTASASASRPDGDRMGRVERPPLPIKTEILLRVSLGDGGDGDAPKPPHPADGNDSGRAVKTYPNRYGEYPMPSLVGALKVPLPSWMALRMMAGEDNVQFDDPKVDREGTIAAGKRNRAERAEAHPAPTFDPQR